MLVSTTPNVEGKKIVKYLGLVSGEAIMGANLFKDLFAGIRDICRRKSSSSIRKRIKKGKRNSNK